MAVRWKLLHHYSRQGSRARLQLQNEHGVVSCHTSSAPAPFIFIALSISGKKTEREEKWRVVGGRGAVHLG